MEKTKGSLNLLSSLQLTEKIKGLDDESKLLLRHKEVLAVILKAVVIEYKEYSKEEIMSFIEADSIAAGQEISNNRTNSSIIGDNGEFEVLQEKLSRFDIVFRAKNPALSNAKVVVNLHFDIEPQKNYHPGYPIEKRGIYYLSRKLASQIPVVANDTNYNILEKCYSIWICRDNIPKDERYTISSFSFQLNHNTSKIIPDKSNYDLLNMVIIRLGEETYNGEEEVLDFLNLLLYPHKENFIDRLGNYIDFEENDILKREVSAMDGLGESILEEGFAKGMETGLAAFVRTLKNVMPDLNSIYQAIIRNEEYADISYEDVARYYEQS